MTQDYSPSQAVFEDVRKVGRNIRRRYALYYLMKNGSPADFDELVTHVSSWETGKSPDEIPPNRQKSVYSSLYQTHIPTLEEHDLVAFDPEEKTVSLTEKTRNLSMEFLADWHSLPWSTIYVTLGMLSFVSIGFRILELISTAVLLDLMTVLLASFAAVVLYAQYRKQRVTRIDAPDYALIIDGRSS